VSLAKGAARTGSGVRQTLRLDLVLAARGAAFHSRVEGLGGHVNGELFGTGYHASKE
jgi:hypothetical protein